MFLGSCILKLWDSGNGHLIALGSSTRPSHITCTGNIARGWDVGSSLGATFLWMSHFHGQIYWMKQARFWQVKILCVNCELWAFSETAWDSVSIVNSVFLEYWAILGSITSFFLGRIISGFFLAIDQARKQELQHFVTSSVKAINYRCICHEVSWYVLRHGSNQATIIYDSWHNLYTGI